MDASLTWQAWAALAITAASVLAMARNMARPDLVLVGAMTLLLLLGVLSPAQATEGFANEGVLTIGVLFVAAAGIQATGALDWAVRRVLGRPRSIVSAQLRMMLPVAAMSAFLNNTPVVAMMLPIVRDWAKRAGISASKLLLPLSWATILGGTVTLIGTSTNLVVTGLANERYPEMTWNIFEIAPIGLITASVGLLYILAFSRWLLPDRGAQLTDLENARDYTVAFSVQPGSPMIGRTIEGVGLRHLPGLYLVEIERGGETLPAVPPETVLHCGDLLVFVGVIESVVDLRRFRGLTPAAHDQVRKLGGPSSERGLVEAVVAHGSPLSGQTIREAAFRTRFRAAIIAVHRNGERVKGKIGDIALCPGDTLLLEAQPSFLDNYRNDRSFALVRGVDGSAPVRHERGSLAALLLAGMVVVSAAGWLSLFTAGLVCGGLMLATRCLTESEARRSVDLNVLLAIAASFALGKALETTGAAAVLGEALVSTSAPFGRFGALAGVYVAVALLTEMITNNAAAALLFPVAMAAAAAADLEPRAMCYVVMFAASASFMTPIGYQTNLMVYGPGGYRFWDFVRFGAPLQVLLAAVNVTTVWFFHVR